VNGYLYVLDRADEMMISGGFDMYPAELENVIAKSEPSVAEKEPVEQCAVHLGNWTPVGKIKRKELREPFWVDYERQVAGT
jgi:hypothetical protein